MKRNIYLYLFTFLSALFTACTGMDEGYKEFLADSDRLYPGRVDSIEISTGIEHIRFNTLISSDPKVKKVIVFWGARAKSKEFEIKADEIGQRKIIEIPSIAEGFHTFEFVTYDMDDNPSVPSVIIGQVYGDNFKKKINDRSLVSSIHSNENEVTVNWAAANMNFADVRVELHYEGIDGSEQFVNVLKEDLITVLPNYKEGNTFKMKTFIKPDDSCLDEYATESKDGVVYSFYDDLKLEKWKIHRFSSERASDPVIRCIDGKETGDKSFWVSSTADGINYPHWVVLDMNENLSINAFYLVQRFSGYPNQIKDMKIFVNNTGEDKEGWTELTSQILLKNADRQIIPLQQSISTRFVKFEFYNDWGGSKFLSLMELGALAIWDK